MTDNTAPEEDTAPERSVEPVETSTGVVTEGPAGNAPDPTPADAAATAQGSDVDATGEMTAAQRRSLAGQTLRHARRVIVLVVGLTVVAAGIAMLALPGPGLVTIVAGLAILATEFAWAQSYLDKTKEKAAQGVDVTKKAYGRIRNNR